MFSVQKTDLLNGSIKRVAALMVSIGIFSVAFLASQAPSSQSPIEEIAWTMIVAVLIAASFLIAWMVSRKISNDLAGIILTAYITFLFYGYIQQFINEIVTFGFIKERFFYQDRVFLPAILIAIVLIYYLSKKFLRWNPIIVRYIAVVMLGLTLWNLALWGVDQQRTYSFSEERSIAGMTLEPPETQFPIFWMVFDAYGRDDVLKQEFNFDNSSFLSDLENRGFSIYGDAISNSSGTIFVLPAIMELENFGTLDRNSLHALIDRKSMMHWRFEESALVSILSQIGYRGVELSSERSPQLISKPFPMFYYEKTGLSALHPSMQLWRKYTRFGLIENMEETATQAINNDVVVFSYNLPPHPPYYFDEYGTFLDPPILRPVQKIRPNRYAQKEKYISQLKFVNSQILTTVDKIIANAKVDPLIIVMSDHGPASNGNEAAIQMEPEERWFNERIPILKAVRIPESCDISEFDKSSNSWNTFNVVLNGCFNASLPIHSDDVWVTDHNGELNLHYPGGVWKPQSDK